MRSLMEHLWAEVPEFRAKEALAYPLAGFLALVALAMFSGVRRGPQDLAGVTAAPNASRRSSSPNRPIHGG